jgi:hypothetical protein
VRSGSGFLDGFIDECPFLGQEGGFLGALEKWARATGSVI